MAKSNKKTARSPGRPSKPPKPSTASTLRISGEECVRCGSPMVKVQLREDRRISGQIQGFIYERIQHWAARCENPACRQNGTIRELHAAEPTGKAG